jgi:hypothetical protein
MLDPNTGFQMNDQQCACYINNFFANLTKNYPKVNEDWLEQASSAGISPEESGGGKKFGEMPAINRHKKFALRKPARACKFRQTQTSGE